MLLVYGDESMDETQQRVCAVAGLIGTEEQWKALEWEWVKFNYGCAFLYGSLRENEPEWTAYLAKKISFEFAKDNPRIQVADLLAREAMKALDNEIGPVKRKIRKSWLTLAKTGRFKIDAFSTDWFESLKRQMPEFERQLNMNRDDYIEWLWKRHRQHSVSAMLQYSDWTARRDKTKTAGV